MSDSPDFQRGHARHETALIHGLSQAEVQKLSESCVEAKGRAYCKWQYRLVSKRSRTLMDISKQAHIPSSESVLRCC